MAAISLLLALLLLSERSLSVPICAAERYVSALGDGGMRNRNARVALEAWNFCNEVGVEAPTMGSPRFADCADLSCPILAGIVRRSFVNFPEEDSLSYENFGFSSCI